MAFEKDMELVRVDIPGSLIFDETKKYHSSKCNECQYVAMVLEGEFELSKCKLDEVFLNTNTG